MQKAPDKEIKFSSYSNIQLKEEDGEFYSEGFVATTHPDKAQSKDGYYVGDICSKNVIGEVVDNINKRNEMVGDLLSYRHDWIIEKNPDLPAAGRATSAEIRSMDDGHWGAYVKTHHNKTHPEIEKHIYEIKNKYIPGYSMEYVAGETKDVTLPKGRFRFIENLSDFKGYGLATGRKIANPNAAITNFGYKEIMDSISNIKENSEEIKMSEEVKDAPAVEPKSAEVAPKEPSTPVDKEPKAPESEAPAEEEEKKEEVDSKEYARFQKFQAMETKEKKAVELKEAVKAALSEVIPENKIQMKENTEMKEVSASVEFKEWKEINDDKIGVKESFRRATRLAERSGILQKWTYSQATAKSCNTILKNFK